MIATAGERTLAARLGVAAFVPAFANRMLLLSILLGLFACGLHHGQMSGLSLSGLDSIFCSADADTSVGTTSDKSPTQTMFMQLGCPLCSSGSLAAPLNTFAWGQEYLPAVAMPSSAFGNRAQAPPRQVRSALNPRASPHDFLASVPIA
ncbi:DUF2946 family protein [Pseudomonas sediminis]|uniref:DUF2946 domain-containing protein n=1 Tax=Pseudomonas sediminis TaxID=1691904 RepID=A0A2G5FFT0_9PSED|nr:DUF2946 family protein [Pseudomonas sediminis]PIA66844.1 hypothetical protein CDO35_18825 [Pseudomonas sediminis]